jgi:hypothetical protein
MAIGDVYRSAQDMLAVACDESNAPELRLSALWSLSLDVEVMMAANVVQLRAAGATWADVGAAIGGVTRQAAQQRWG